MMQTSPPTKRNFNSLVNQWVIYDRYMAYEAAKERAEENEAKMDGTLVSSHVRKRLTQPESEAELHQDSSKILGSGRIYYIGGG